MGCRAPFLSRAITGASDVAVRAISLTRPDSASWRWPASVLFDVLLNRPGCEWRSKESVAPRRSRAGPDGVGAVAQAAATNGTAEAARKPRRLSRASSGRASARARSRDQDSKQRGPHTPSFYSRRVYDWRNRRWTRRLTGSARRSEERRV